MALAITVQTAFLCITGDEILELNGKSLHGLTHDEALKKFKVYAKMHIHDFIAIYKIQ